MRMIKKIRSKPIRTEFSYLVFFLSFPFCPTYAIVGDGVQNNGHRVGEEEQRMSGETERVLCCFYSYVITFILLGGSRYSFCSFVPFVYFILLLFFALLCDILRFTGVQSGESGIGWYRWGNVVKKKKKDKKENNTYQTGIDR
jgi:hypothetical protein